MIRRFTHCALVIFAISWSSFQLHADVYELSNGERIEGDPISFDAGGVVFKKLDQTFAPRVGWTNFTDAALKKLSEFPQGKKFADELITEEETPEEEIAQQEIKPKDVPRLDRLPPSAGLLGMAGSPLGLGLLILIYLANIYAGFEVAVFRNYPVWIVCLLAALLPFVGPIIFLCLPTRVPGTSHAAYETPVEHMPPEEAHAAYAEAPAHAAAPAPAPVHTQEKAAAPSSTVYQRGTTTFNRRFFETKLANFMRVVPSEQDKDLVLVVKSARGDHVGSRISRVSPNDLSLQVNKGGASAEVTLPFTEIKEVQVCHKDAVEQT